MRWYPYREEIPNWLTIKEHEFALLETQGLRVNLNRWKDKYLYIDMYETFFVELPYLLYEWLKRKTANNLDLWPLEPVVCDQATLDRVKTLENKWTQAIDLWLARVNEGYIIGLVVEYTDSFNKVERKFTEGPRKRMLEEIQLWIKMLFMEKELMHMDPDKMDE